MKFTLLFERSEKTKTMFEKFRKDGYAYGIKMIRLDEVDVVDMNTGEFINHAYACRCKSNIISYLVHKFKSKGMTHILGWKLGS